MKTYKFDCRSTRGGFKQWALLLEDGEEIGRIDRNVQVETVREFRERVSAQLEAEGYTPEPNQYTL